MIAGAAAIAFGADGKQGLAITLGAWVLAGSVWEVLWRARFLSAPLSETARRILNMRRGQFGATLGHIGLAVTVIGIAGATAWNVERLAVMKIGDTIDLGTYQLTFKKVYEQAGPNYAEFAGDFDLKSGGSAASARSQRRSGSTTRRRRSRPQPAFRPGPWAMSTSFSATRTTARSRSGPITIPSFGGFGVER